MLVVIVIVIIIIIIIIIIVIIIIIIKIIFCTKESPELKTQPFKHRQSWCFHFTETIVCDKIFFGRSNTSHTHTHTQHMTTSFDILTT